MSVSTPAFWQLLADSRLLTSEQCQHLAADFAQVKGGHDHSNAKALAARLAHHGYRIVSGGTDNHLMLVDLRPKGLNGKLAQETLDQAGVTVNKNGIPFDTEPISKGGGIRVGTPAVTTRGMKEEEMMDIADFMHRALGAIEKPADLAKIRDDVRVFTRKYPLPF